jgi:hypothetical protein
MAYTINFTLKSDILFYVCLNNVEKNKLFSINQIIQKKFFLILLFAYYILAEL